jgi:DNA-binding MarR family transcriptional regulator
MARDQKDERDWSAAWGSAEWAATQTDPKAKLMAELVMEVRGSQDAVHQMDEAAYKAMGINATDGRCVDIIDRRGPMTAGQLAKEAGLTTGAVTAVLDRLERKGYVRRVHDTKDRRRVMVEITEKAREAALELYGPLKDMGWDFQERLSEDDLRLLIEFNRLSREINQRRAAEIREQLRKTGED